MRGNRLAGSVQAACRRLFGAVAVGGILSIAILVVVGAPTVLVASTAVAVVTLYGVALSRISGGVISERQSGDSLNNLGFILALAILTFTMWMYVAWRTDAPKIVESFAAALASITTGFGLKVLVQLFRTEPDEVEEDIRGALADLSREVHVQVLGVVQDLAMVRSTLSAEFGQRSARATAVERDSGEVTGSAEWLAELTTEIHLLRKAIEEMASREDNDKETES